VAATQWRSDDVPVTRLNVRCRQPMEPGRCDKAKHISHLTCVMKPSSGLCGNMLRHTLLPRDRAGSSTRLAGPTAVIDPCIAPKKVTIRHSSCAWQPRLKSQLEDCQNMLGKQSRIFSVAHGFDYPVSTAIQSLQCVAPHARKAQFLAAHLSSV